LQTAEQESARISALDIFLACTRIALTSFGSPPFWARRELVERRRWIGDQEFLELMALGQMLPGANVLNLLIVFAYRHCGPIGALAATMGFVAPPFLIVIGLGVLYQHFGGLAWVHNVLIGMSAAAAGLLLATGIKMAAVLPRRWLPWLCCVLGFIGVGVFRWPLPAVLFALAPFTMFAAWKGKL
jgi:chromate transporter